jgi:hypothetical protein
MSRAGRSTPSAPTTRAVAIATMVAAAVAFLTSLAGIDARATVGARVTADEPYYLLTADSLGSDGDLDIGDEIAAGAHLPYHEIPLDPQTSVLDDGRRISPHDPLLPVLLAAPMAIGGWAWAKATLAVIAGLAAAATVLVAVRRWAVAPTAAAVVTSAAFAGLPLAGYGTQIYPEMPAALAAVVGFGAVVAPCVRRRHQLVGLAAVVALPWLAVKYVPIAAVLAVALLVRTDGRRRRTALAAGLGVAGLAYLAAHRAWYGGWTAYATGDHFEQTGEFSVIGTDVDLLGRSRRLVGLLVDRDFGLAAWSPIWLLLPFAVVLAARRRPPGWAVWTGLVTAGWLSATFVALTMHGWWLPGRQVVVVMPIAIVGIAWLVERCAIPQWTIVVAGVLGAWNWLWLAFETSTGRRTLVVDFMDTAALPRRLWAPLLPAGLDGDAAATTLLAAWAVLLAGAVLAFGRAVSRRSRPSPASPAAPPPSGGTSRDDREPARSPVDRSRRTSRA